ncbi:MAG: FadR family transcriptional regulator, partial [Leucobacter sp.]|nr:FadR family transcriptional regulator [Leucobacter sp.]
AVRADEHDIVRIEAALSHRSTVPAERWAEADSAVHEEIARAAHNPILFEIYTALLPRLQDSVQSAITRDGFRRDDPRGHEEVLDAIRRRDPNAAGDSAAANLAATERWDIAERAGTVQ